MYFIEEVHQSINFLYIEAFNYGYGLFGRKFYEYAMRLSLAAQQGKEEGVSHEDPPVSTDRPRRQ